MNIAFGMIVLNGNYVLQECLESAYPYASQILVAEGPVQYWQEQGVQTSDDGTNDILHDFYDPDDKLTVVHSQYSEKNEQCNAYMPYLHNDTDYLWNLDSDEIFKPEDMERIVEMLTNYQISSVGFKSYSFYGGFDHYLTGFEEDAEFIRIRKVSPGARWSTHRPPTIMPPQPGHHVGHNALAQHGIRMYHYSYVFPKQVKQKVSYYKAAVSKNNCIDDYYENIYEPWVKYPEQREQIEKEWEGVHEFKPSMRGPCYTAKFDGEHPEIIQKNMEKLRTRFHGQL
jgi:hypothetical protein